MPIAPANANDAGYPNVGDTIDPRQKDQTHTALVALNDIWQLSGRQQLQISGFFRTYNLSLFSDFGQGLIRQSEFRTATGQGANYVNKIAESLSLLLGMDYQREAPRRDNLDHYNFYTPGDFTYGPFTKVDSNNVTISSVAPYAAGSGAILRIRGVDAAEMIGGDLWRRVGDQHQRRFPARRVVTPHTHFRAGIEVH